MTTLLNKKCKPCEGGASPLSIDFASKLLLQLNKEWSLSSDGKHIYRSFELKNHYQITAFLNAVNWISHKEDHHPDVSYGYKNCSITYTTHAINGLSENDFICAAKIDVLAM